MTTEQFRSFWSDNYPDSYPIGHELKWIYKDRWFRIHSLPESKRYAESEDEYKIILERQNKLITDIFGEELDFFILIGLYTNDITNENYTYLDYLNQFIKVETIDLHKIRPDEYKNKLFYDIYVKKAKWEEDLFNDSLKRIADDVNYYPLSDHWLTNISYLL